jgi:hypothetical protein
LLRKFEPFSDRESALIPISSGNCDDYFLQLTAPKCRFQVGVVSIGFLGLSLLYLLKFTVRSSSPAPGASQPPHLLTFTGSGSALRYIFQLSRNTFRLEMSQ